MVGHRTRSTVGRPKQPTTAASTAKIAIAGPQTCSLGQAESARIPKLNKDPAPGLGHGDIDNHPFLSQRKEAKPSSAECKEFVAARGCPGFIGLQSGPPKS